MFIFTMIFQVDLDDFVCFLGFFLILLVRHLSGFSEICNMLCSIGLDM